MKVGLFLQGTPTDGVLPTGWLHRAQRWLHDAWADTLVASQLHAADARGRPTLAFQLHPCAPDIEIAAVPGSRLEIRAETWQTGPGYHRHVEALLGATARELAVAWHGPPDCADSQFDRRLSWPADPTVLERLMLERLQQASTQALEQLRAGRVPAAFALPETHGFDCPGALCTPLGPRDAAWLRDVGRDPLRGTDAFAWWEPGRDARYKLGRALAMMWTAVRWRTPITDDETSQWAQVLSLLREAHQEAPTLCFPWREWDELRAFTDDRAPLPAHEPPPPSRPIGYRRRDVQVRPARQWTITLPGSFAELWDENGVYNAWAGGKTVTFASLPVSAGEPPASAEALLPELDPGETPLALPGLPAAFARRAGLSDLSSGGETLRRVSARIALPGELVAVSVTFDDPSGLDWAIGTLESVRHRSVSASPG